MTKHHNKLDLPLVLKKAFILAVIGAGKIIVFIKVAMLNNCKPVDKIIISNDVYLL